MKNIKIAVLMDDISNINPKKDSTFAIMLEAQSRGWEIYTFDSCDMFYKDNTVVANCSKTKVNDSLSNWYFCDTSKIINLQKMDIVFMRKDPPFNMDYIYATYLLEKIEDAGVLVINKPSSLRDANEKLFCLNFPSCIPDTIVSANIEQIDAFIQKNKTIVVKPLDGMGGINIYKLAKGDSNIKDILLKLTNNGKRLIVAQEFLEDIKYGDKRILIINGNPVDYAIARIPAKGNFKGNLAAGASAKGQSLSTRDRYLCEKIKPALIKKGLFFVGLDVIGDYITEINVTSPTCIRELDSIFNLNVGAILLDEITKKLTTISAN